MFVYAKTVPPDARKRTNVQAGCANVTHLIV